MFEASRSVGGRARAIEIDGRTLDNGQHILLGAYGETLRLMRLVGVDARQVFVRQRLELLFPDSFHLSAPGLLPAPLHLLVALLAAKGLRLRDRMAAVRLMLALKRSRFVVEPDVTVATLLGAHGQTPTTRRFLWEPLCIAALNTMPEDASAQVFATVLADAFSRTRADSDLLLPACGLEHVFPLAAERNLTSRGGEVRFGQRVLAVSRLADGWRLQLDDGHEDFDAVICAVPPHATHRLLDGLTGLPPGLRESLLAFEYEPIVTVYLQFAGSRAVLPLPMIGMTGGLAQWVFDRARMGGPPGSVAVVVSAAARLLGLEGAELARAAGAELGARFPQLGEVLWARTIIEKRATFRCRPGLHRPPVDSGVPGLFLAGDHVDTGYPATLEGAVRSGVRAARELVARRR